jgi:hypothetical protein
LILAYPEGGLMYPITYPLRPFAREQKISPTYIYDLIAQGKIRSVLIKKRRHIFPEDWRRLAEEQAAAQAGAKLPSPNPKVARAAPPAPAAEVSAKVSKSTASSRGKRSRINRRTRNAQARRTRIGRGSR